VADEKEGEVTDLEALCAFWNVDQEEAIRGALHLARELIDHDQTGGEILLKGLWQRSLWGFTKKRRVERIRFRDHSEAEG
jgi:hypothetical protein